MIGTKYQSQQNGFTLVELLVGVLISLFMIAAALTYMVSSINAFRTQSNDAFSSDNARFILEYLSQSVRRAGLDQSNDLNLSLDVIYNGDRCAAGEATSNQAGNNRPCTVDNLANSSDRFAIDFVITGDETGCNGQNINVPIGGTLRIANVYWTADIDNDGVRSLYCQPINLTANTPVGNAAPIIDGIDAIQIQYGVDIEDGAGNFDGIVNAYQSYANLVAPNPGNPSRVTERVKSIRIAMLINSGVAQAEDAVSSVGFDQSFQLLDGPVMAFQNDGIFRQVYSTTIMLPNGQ